MEFSVKRYDAFRGVDYSASPAVISEDHASDMLNMYIGRDGVMQKRPGWHILRTMEYISEFSPDETYNVGEYVIYDDLKRVCIRQHSGAWDSTHFSGIFSRYVSYSVGDYCTREGNIYRCVNAHQGAWVNSDFEIDNPARRPINGLHYVQYRPGMGLLFIHAGDKLYGTMFRPQNVGDVNGTGTITSADAGAILRYLSGLVTFTDEQKAKADWNNDGVITEEDAAGILRYVVGDEPFPEGYNGVLAEAYFVVTKSDGTSLTLKNQRSVSFESGGCLYILDGDKYYRIVDDVKQKTTTLSGRTLTYDYVNTVYAEEVDGYIPTTGICGHYEYKEPESEVEQGETIIAHQTATAMALSNDAEAVFPAEMPFLNNIKVNILLNSTRVCSNLELSVTRMSAEVAGLTLTYVSGSVIVRGLTAGDTIKMSIYQAADPGIEIEDEELVVVQEATKTATAVSDEATATVTALRKFTARMEVTFGINGSYICESEEFTSADNILSIGIYKLKYDDGTVTVEGLQTGDKITVFVKNPDKEVFTVAEPGGTGNEGEWSAPSPNEARNLLQTKQINTFLSDGIHKAYYLTENNCIVNKVELFLKTRCKSVNGVDTPTQDEINIIDAGTSPNTGIYYYYKYLWIEIHATSEFATFSTSTAYAVGALVKRSGKYYKCISAHSAGAWNASHFQEVNAYTASDASSNTPIQNKISYTTKILFASTPVADNDNAENIRVTFSPRKHSSAQAIAKDRGYIEKCTIATRYGYFNNNRFFLSGNPEHRNWDFASGIDDPTYFPNDGWTRIGSDLTAIMGYLHYGSELAIVKEDNEQDATVYMRSASVTEDGEVIFPVRQGAQGVGAVAKGAFATLRDDPLFLAKEGVFAIEGTDASQERNIPNRSFYVDAKLHEDIGKQCVATAWDDYYVLCNPVTGRCYVADTRYMDSKDGRAIYNWCVWDNVPAQCFCVVGDRLFFGTVDGRLCVFNTDWDSPKRYSDGAEFVDGATVYHKWAPYDGGYQINAYYITKRDHLGSYDFKKTMLNDGGVITLVPQKQSGASISVITDKGDCFVDEIKTDSDEPSVVVPIRHRVKNFESIETRIENKRINEGLAIIGIQYRYAITTNRRNV